MEILIENMSLKNQMEILDLRNIVTKITRSKLYMRHD